MDYKTIVRSVLGNKKLSVAQKLFTIKQSVDSGDYRNALANPAFSGYLLKEPTFKSVAEIKLKEPFSFTEDFKKEFRWLAYIVEHSLPEINAFIMKKLDFERQVMSGKYEVASQVLRMIEGQHGVSLWSIEATILIADLFNGSEANWHLLSNYLNEINHSIYNFNISAASKRAESNLSYDSYLNQFQNDLDNIQAVELLKDYFVFKNFNSTAYDYKFKDLSSVLYVSNIFSVIDQYLILVELMVYHVASSPVNDKLFFNFIKKAQELVPADARIANLYNVINHKGELAYLNGGEAILSYLDAYYTGDFERALIDSALLITQDPSEYQSYLIYCKSLIGMDRVFEPLGLGPIADQLLLDTYQLLSFSKKDEDCLKRLLKTSVTLTSFNISKQICALLIEIEGGHGWQSNAAVLVSAFYSPRNIIFSAERSYTRNNFAALDNRQCFQVAHYKAAENADRRNLSAAPRQEIFFQAAHLYALGRYSEVETVLAQLLEPLSGYYMERKNTFNFNVLLQLDRLKDALLLFTTIYFDDELVFRKINFVVLFNKIKSLADYQELVPFIDHPILYSLLVKEYDLYEAYDDFMAYHNIESIRDIHVDRFINSFGLTRTVYFLNHVVTIDTLKYNTDYGSISDVEDDRIYVLKLLVSLDHTNKTVYEKERDEIYRASSVRKVLKEVDEGRLYIDVNNLRALQVKKFNDDFKRFKEIEFSSASQPLIGFNSFSTKNWEKPIVEKNEVPDNYNTADYLAFKNIYLESRDNFLFSKEYGLDSCLSTRIRHGALKNHLRSVFEKLDLMSSRSKETYNDNAVWAHQLACYPELNARVQQRMKLFSKQIDDYTIYIRDSLIQIQTEKQSDKINGLFAYFTNDELLFNFYSEYKHFLISVDKAIEIILTHLVNYTLIFIQETIATTFSTVIAEYFKGVIESAIADLRKMDIPAECQLISNLTKSSTDINQELEYLLEWFYLNTTSSSSILSIRTLLDASLNLTNRINPLFNLVPNVTMNMELAAYSSLIFVFNILLKNVIVHSNLEPAEIQLNVDAALTADEKYAFITFTNNVRPEDDYKANIKKLQAVKESWNDHELIERSNTEGESGYDKIKRILLYEALAKSDRFDFDFIDHKISVTLFFPYNKPLGDAQHSDH